MKGFDRIARNAQIEREDLRRTLLCARICAALGRTDVYKRQVRVRLQCDFWAVLQAESTPKAAGRQRFPRSATPVLNNGCEKPPRTPGTMSKSGAVCCETVQKSPYEDETGAALRGGIGLAFIVMGLSLIHISPGRKVLRL